MTLTTEIALFLIGGGVGVLVVVWIVSRAVLAAVGRGLNW